MYPQHLQNEVRDLELMMGSQNLKADSVEPEPAHSAGAGQLDPLDIPTRALLTDVYEWLHEGPMDSWVKRCSLHQRIGDVIGKERVLYHAE